MRGGTREAFIVLPCGLESRGGIGQAVRNLLEGWHGRPDAPSVRVIDSWHVEWRIRRSPSSPVYFLGAIIAIVAARLRRRLGLLHLNMAGRGSIVRKCLLVWLGTFLRVPVIVHVHASGIADQIYPLPSWLKAPLRATIDRARYVIVLGSFWHRFFVDHLGINPTRVVTVPYGVPEPMVARTTPPGDGEPLRLLFLGRLGVRKGTPEVLQALADPRLRARDWDLVLAGDGEIEAMRVCASALGIADRCSFSGWIDRNAVARLLATSDILLLPSRQEGLPVAILEAMAYGLAIVTTRAGAIEDAITDRDTGLLVPIGDVRALADAVVELVSRPELRRALQRAARARQQREYSLGAYADRILELYRRCGLV